jgi:hypothetical protein
VEILLIKVAPIIILQLFGIDLNYIFQDYKIKLLRKNKKKNKKKKLHQNIKVKIKRGIFICKEENKIYEYLIKTKSHIFANSRYVHLNNN